MILVRAAADDQHPETDCRLSADWSGMEVLLSPTAAPAQLQDAIATAVKHRLPLVIPRLTRAELGRVVIRIARVAPEMGVAAVVVSTSGDPCTTRATFTPLSFRQRIRPAIWSRFHRLPDLTTTWGLTYHPNQEGASR